MLLGALLCVTLVLSPVGILAFMLSRRLFRTAGQLVVPRAVRHPLQAAGDAASDAADDLGKKTRKRVERPAGKAAKKAKKKVRRAARKL